MASTKPTQILVSGTVTTDEFIASAGDIRIYRRDDKSGASARHGSHCNYGYSGYYLANIFDGKDWRKLQFNKLIPYERRSYEQARDCLIVVNNIKHIVSLWSGIVAIYDSNTRSFRIQRHEYLAYN